MGYTIAQKIIKEHLISGDMTVGSEVALKIDQTLTQDATGTMAYLEFETMGLDRVKVVRNGSVAKRPSSPNVPSDAIKGLLGGIALAIVSTFFIHITNNKITSADDVEKVLGISVLTVIPFNQSKLKKK